MNGEGRTDTFELAHEDAALILRENGNVEVVFAERDEEDVVPQTALLAFALSQALHDEELFTRIRENFETSWREHFGE